MTASPASVTTRRPAIGLVVLVVAVLGAIHAIALLLVPAAVAPDVWSYPLAADAYAISQGLIALHHLVLALGLLAAWRLGLAGSSRFAAVSAIAAVVAMVLLAVVEVVAIGAAAEVGATDLVGALGGAYGAATLLLALASILFGVAILRATRWTGVTRLTVLVTGIFLVVPMVPAQFDPLFWARIAVAVWSLLYVGLGVGLRRGVRQG